MAVLILLFGYLIAIFIAPLIGTLAYGIASMTLRVFLGLFSRSPGQLFKQFIFQILGFITTFISVWFSSEVFLWLKLQPTLLMVIIIGIAFFLDQFKETRKYRGERADLENADLWGGLFGIVMAAVVFLH